MENKTNKKELIEKTILEFQQLNEYDKMLILGYMLRVQQERQIQTTQEEQDGKVQRTDNAPPASRAERETAGRGGADGGIIKLILTYDYSGSLGESEMIVPFLFSQSRIC